MQLADRLTLDAPKRTTDGYLAVRARAARTGVYDYLAGEVGAPDSFKATDTVKVYRDASEVFAADSVRSFIGRPITNDHPRDAVTSSNWKDHARGVVMGAMRDGEYLAFDLVLMDAGAIKAVEDGKRELSNGYQCQLDWTPGVAPDGTAYDARQVGIKGNHVALVDRGRAGSECAIKDGEKFALCDANPAALADTKEKPTMKIRIGDAEVDATNGEAVRIAVDGLNTKLSAQETQIGKLTADLATASTAIETKDGEITALQAKLKDAEVTPEKLQKLADARADVIGKAKALAPNIVADGKSDAEIRKEAVTAKLGDAAKDMPDAAIEGAFAALTKDAKVDPIVAAFKGGLVSFAADTASIRDAARAARNIN
jgi:hypothetical protein